MSAADLDALRRQSSGLISVEITEEDDGETFEYDEEPHMFPLNIGTGFYPMSLGQKLDDGKYEIVRKLGYGGHSSVWLARLRE